jgi:seryl-tRNA synthetase
MEKLLKEEKFRNSMLSDIVSEQCNNGKRDMATIRRQEEEIARFFEQKHRLEEQYRTSVERSNQKIRHLEAELERAEKELAVIWERMPEEESHTTPCPKCRSSKVIVRKLLSCKQCLAIREN